MGRATRDQALAVAFRVSQHWDQVPAVWLQSPRPGPWIPHGRWQGLRSKPRDSDLDLSPLRRQGSQRGRRTQEASRFFPPPALTLPKAALAPEGPAEARAHRAPPRPNARAPPARLAPGSQPRTLTGHGHRNPSNTAGVGRAAPDGQALTSGSWQHPPSKDGQEHCGDARGRVRGISMRGTGAVNTKGKGPRSSNRRPPAGGAREEPRARSRAFGADAAGLAPRPLPSSPRGHAESPPQGVCSWGFLGVTSPQEAFSSIQL